MRRPLRFLRPSNFRNFLALQLVVGGKVVVLFINPCMSIIVFVYFSLRSQVEPFYKELFSPPVLYMGLLCFVFGNFFYVYSNVMGCMKREHYSLIKWALFIFCYWVMASIAGFIALFQLIFKPHYWEKTHHGLHLQSNEKLLQFESALASFDDITKHPTVLLESSYGTILPSISHLANEDENLSFLSTQPLPAIKGTEHVSTAILQRDGSLTDAEDEENTQISKGQSYRPVSPTMTQQEKDRIAEDITKDIEHTTTGTLQQDGRLV